MKKLITFFIMTSLLLSSCISKNIQHTTDTDNVSSQNTSEETVLESNDKISDVFPVGTLLIGDTDISRYTVVCSADSDDTVKYAADELVSYIHAAVGVRLKISTESADNSIYIGANDKLPNELSAMLTETGDEGYALYCHSGDLYIASNTSRGTLYGVYSFLEDHLGVRYYTSDCERILKNEKITVPDDLSVSFKPAFAFRDCFWFDTLDGGFSAKQKINSCMSRELDSYGGGISYAGTFVHTLGSLAETGSATPCLTNDDIYNNVLKNAKKWLDENPEAKIISISQNDGSTKGCQCNNCKAINSAQGSEMGSLLTFVNKIAIELKKDYPYVYIDTLSYGYTKKPPKNIIPEDNVIIRLSTVDCCFSHGISECTQNEELKSSIEDWGKICKNLYVWDFTSNFMYYLAPFPNLYTMYDNIRYMYENNVTGILEQGNFQSSSGEFGELRAYLLSKLMWEPDMSEEKYTEYLHDFLEGYYGEGWEHILEYINITSEEASHSHMSIQENVKTVFPKGRTEDELDVFANELIALWDKAYNEANDTVCKRHVEKSRLQVYYYLLCVCWDDGSSPDVYKNVYEIIKKYNITHYRENKKIPQITSFDSSPYEW